MDDLTKFFPGCNLSTEEIRANICMILSVRNSYFCYKCFKLLGMDALPKNADLCKKCYQFYCKNCSKTLGLETEPSKCLQCTKIRQVDNLPV